MKDFAGISFIGRFRTYQQRVLDNAKTYLADGKINIVAAPGSGKTILGLELIRRLGNPCIIFSPTTTIQYQWGQRFEQTFLPQDENIDSFFSYNLHDIRLLNSITYQALYSAMKKLRCEDDEESVDYSDIDLFSLIRQSGIKTICLDEAHHLQNEWQKALEVFVGGLDEDIKIISLTATPPYDANRNEWERYRAVCGEIDEEIFVPELVKEKTLCPHQDYIYFNYPTAAELNGFYDYRANCLKALEQLSASPLLNLAYDFVQKHSNDYELLFSNAKEYIALLVLCQHSGITIDLKLIKSLTTSEKLPRFSLEFAQTAVQFLLDDEQVLSEENRQALKGLFKADSLLEKGKVCLAINEKMKRQLASSMGKLDSIAAIAEAETKNLGYALHMLILTDYIRKETVGDIGSDHELSNISIVSIFETLRRSGTQARIGAVSGSLIILPRDTMQDVDNWRTTELPGTDYVVCTTTASNKEKVAEISRLFEDGKINILIGTKSLLGEGWDSPCINSLILASFVGSFMLSNQMRGRAIRTDKKNPEKVSNIWHLVTLEPEYLFTDNKTKQLEQYLQKDNNTIVSEDFRVLSRRFECFVGPAYETGEIENGIDRISILKPPFNHAGIEKINVQMLEKAARRSEVESQWNTSVKPGSFLHEVSEIPKDRKIPVFTFVNVLPALVLAVAEVALIQSFAKVFLNLFRDGSVGLGVILLCLAAIFVVGVFTIKAIARLITLSNPNTAIKSMAKALLKTLQEIDMISSTAVLKTFEDSGGMFVQLCLSQATVHEQNIFNAAIAEMLSPIDNPRYLIIMQRGKFRSYRCSYACPSVIGQKKEYAEILKARLKKIGKFEVVYTRNDAGRKLILTCRREAYITGNAKLIDKKKKVVNWE